MTHARRGCDTDQPLTGVPCAVETVNLVSTLWCHSKFPLAESVITRCDTRSMQLHVALFRHGHRVWSFNYSNTQHSCTRFDAYLHYTVPRAHKATGSCFCASMCS